MNKLILLLLIFPVFTLSAQTEINNITLPAVLDKEGSKLVLNGGGIRKKLFFKIYVGGLYLPEKSKNAKEIINADKPMAIRLHITSSMVSSDNMSEATREGFIASTDGNTAPIQDKIDAFIANFSGEEITENDIFDLYYVPGEGVKSYKNGKYISTVSGMDFKKALIGIWLSDNPVDSGLKEAMLNL
ncbi:MAG: chalcone isomerase family protein [Chitinophagales bacterium]